MIAMKVLITSFPASLRMSNRSHCRATKEHGAERNMYGRRREHVIGAKGTL